MTIRQAIASAGLTLGEIAAIGVALFLLAGLAERRRELATLVATLVIPVTILITLVVMRMAGLTFNPNGSYSFDPSDAAYQHLPVGVPYDVVASYTVTDAQSATSTATWPSVPRS